jgi:hypothetical protein
MPISCWIPELAADMVSLPLLEVIDTVSKLFLKPAEMALLLLQLQMGLKLSQESSL